jgi:hypothetical protein
MKKIGIITFVTAISFSLSAQAWWDGGHMIVANIAYLYLTPKAKASINELMPYMAYENTIKHRYDYRPSHPNYTFMSLSHWADDIKSYPNFIRGFTTWHYIEDAYSIDNTPTPALVPRDNVVTAINNLKSSLHSKAANPYVKVRALALLIHFVGDIHQPLHAGELYSKQFPHGDRGGNSYAISYYEADGYKINNLHKLWDSAIAVYPKLGFRYNVNDEPSIDVLSRKIAEALPKDKLLVANDLNPKHWQKESHLLAINAHQTPYNQVPPTTYIEENSKVLKRQLALAGYRLAGLLNKAFN